MREEQRWLGLVGILLQYPHGVWWESLPDIQNDVEALSDIQMKAIVSDFIEYLTDMGHKAYEDAYVRTFDFSKNTNLYLSTHDCTDVGKQAAELVEYKAFFLENGFDIEHEMPDYLPVLLELCTEVEPKEAFRILQFAQRKINVLRERFIEAQLPYAFLIDIILTMMNRLEVAQDVS